ncbi:hypothetical protein [Nocardioides dongkuii]|uniref:hypothetical protein n=1 Tax=Nocardioides dongkuii TaxID=2760089 RepID=UPI0015F96B24|nr:hypothetical protein [Nocardioides dongkuii]
MTEHHLSTLLREHLADEPPVRLSAADAMRTGRRQTLRLRRLVAGAGALAVTAVTAVAALDGTGVIGRGSDADPVAQEAPEPVLRSGPLDQVMEAVAADGFTPYAGALGEPRWSVNDVLGRPVEPGDPAAQVFLLDYRPAGTPRVNLTVGGFAQEDRENYPFEGACASGLARGTLAECTETTLEDGSLLTTSVGPISQVGGDSPRLLTMADVEGRDPGTFAWSRVVAVDSADNVSTRASEYVRGADVEEADWQVPVEALRALALDPSLLAADVAHEPMPLFTGE